MWQGQDDGSDRQRMINGCLGRLLDLLAYDLSAPPKSGSRDIRYEIQVFEWTP